MEHRWVAEIFLGAAVLYSLYLHLRNRRSAGRASPASAAPGPPQLYVLASRLYRCYEESAQPADLVQYAEFQEGVRLFNSGPYSTPDLLAYYSGDNAILACMAMEALSRRPATPQIRDDVLSVISSVAPWTRYFALQVLAAHVPADQPVVGPLLLRTENSWTSRICLQFLRELIGERTQGGEALTFGGGLEKVSEAQGKFLQQLLEQLGPALVGPLSAELMQWQRTRIDMAFLSSIGKVWSDAAPADADPVIEHEALRNIVLALEAGFGMASPRSVLLVGESGVGKTAIARALARRLQAAGWVIFEAGQNELVAGQVYIGQIEERLRNLVQQIGGQRRVLWFVPEFHGLLWAGRHLHSETSALDFLLPYIEQGEIVVLGETQPAAFERLTLVKPRCATALVTSRVEPLSESATLDLAREWMRRHTREGQPHLLSEATLREASQLSQQYLGDQAAPGRLLKFLDLTRKRLQTAGGSGAIQIRIDDLIVTLTQLTGLPESILDDRHNLNLTALRQLFEKRVLGQPEAVDCLVERVAMIKAGVTDPARPQGVFLFAGPTGTGKTEIAKTLAEFLFGSPNRMIRLDMSELQTADSLVRLLGSVEGKTEGSLVDAIRKQPFSVVLLDEFEKAHPNVWDLFLQVFDDGRLTDRAGNTADFRHAIVVMTTNLGGVIPSGTSLGFARDSVAFRPQEVERAIAQAFRRELLNRIDRVVIFHPLTRDTMRDILRRELDEITSRRGLRNRSWAIEWEDDAIEFLLARGFTADLGARPLKRAIERYLLSPLALTIVNHQFPEGDQFLYVKAEDDGLAVQFVDPGASTEPIEAEAEPRAGSQALDAAPQEPMRLERIAFEPRGTAAEIHSLQHHYDRIRSGVEHADWQGRKQELLAMTANRDFWHSAERFRILGEAEYMDRVEHGLRGAGSLLQRLLGSRPGAREHYPRDPVERLAEQLFLLDAACASVRERQPRDAFLLVEAGRDLRATATESNAFARRIGGMYRAWAKKRRMFLETIEELDRDGKGPYRLAVAVSGYGAYRILHPEEGLHVLESSGGGDGASSRCKTRVRVVPQPDEPAGKDAAALRRQAVAAFRSTRPAQVVVVRRYRERPAPLVRDRVRGWRSGKLERVLAGDFDLIVREE